MTYIKIDRMSLRRMYRFFFFYVPYRAYLYYKASPTPKFSAFILLLFLLSSNVFSVFLLMNRFFVLGFFESASHRATTKFIVVPLFLSPFVLLMLLFLWFKKDELKLAFKEFDNYSELNRKVADRYYWFYVCMSVVLFFASLTSPLWL